MPGEDPCCCCRAGGARAGWGRERGRELQSPSRPSQPCLARRPWGHFGAPADGEGSASGNCLPLPGRREEEDSPEALNPPLPLLSSCCSTREHQAVLEPGSAAPTASPGAPHPPEPPAGTSPPSGFPGNADAAVPVPHAANPQLSILPRACGVSGMRIPAPSPPSLQGKWFYPAGTAPLGAVS